eukprot:1763950-Prorocentrum_lima.AAC.1
MVVVVSGVRRMFPVWHYTPGTPGEGACAVEEYCRRVDAIGWGGDDIMLQADLSMKKPVHFGLPLLPSRRARVRRHT